MMPFDWRMWARLTRLALADARGPARFFRVAFVSMLCPLIVVLGSIGMALDWVFYPRLRRTRVVEPVFVVGMARSGTTLMHKLLARDPRFCTMLTYEMVLPSIVQKRLVRWAIAFDDAYLGGALARRVLAWEDRIFAKGRQMHPMGLTQPEEDAFLLAPTFLQAQIGFLFPYQNEIDELFYFDRRPTRLRARLLRFYENAVRRHVYLHGGAERPVYFLSKNPTFTGMLRSLRERFPDARFIVMMRNPYETIPSLLKMMVRNWRMLGYPRHEIDAALEQLAQQMLYYYQYPFEALSDLPDAQHAYVGYTELVEHPAATIAQLYERFGLVLRDEFREALRAEEGRAGRHRREHVYSLEEFGLSREQIRAALPEAFDRFGWSPPDEAPPD